MIASLPEPLKKWLASPSEEAVTYIAALRSPEGIVISADTLESHADEAVYVEKICVEHNAGPYQMALAGAGRTELIEGLIQSVMDGVRKERPMDGTQLERTLQSILKEFYQKDVRLFPGRGPGAKQIKFIIAATKANANPEEVYLWRTAGARIFKVTNRVSIGYGAPSCEYTLRRMYRNNLPLSQAVLLSVYLVAIAKQIHPQQVGGDTQIVIVKDNGIAPEDAEYVKNLELRLRDYEQRLNTLFLACADTSISVNDLKKMVDEQFTPAILGLHCAHMDAYVSGLTLERVMQTNDAYPKIPLGSVVKIRADTTLSLEHDPAQIEASRRKLEIARILGGAGPIRLTVHCPCSKNFDVELPNFSAVAGREFECECGRKTAVKGVPSEDIRLKLPVEQTEARIVVKETDIHL